MGSMFFVVTEKFAKHFGDEGFALFVVVGFGSLLLGIIPTEVGARNQMDRKIVLPLEIFDTKKRKTQNRRGGKITQDLFGLALLGTANSHRHG